MTTSEDTRIMRELQQALQWDTRLDSSHIETIVGDGVVTLVGWVNSAAEREAAIEDAYQVPGVMRVIAQVEIVPGTDRGEEAIEADLRAALERDLRIDERLIVTEVNGSIVRLTGSVTTLAEKMAAEEAAWRISGVTRVVNSIVVLPLVNPEDAEIEANLLAALAGEPRIKDPNHISVTSMDRRVYLRGTVRTLAERRLAELLAQQMPGVIEVHNQLVGGGVPREPRAIRRPRT